MLGIPCSSPLAELSAMPSAAVLSRFSRLAYVWERLQEAAHTVKQISDELFRARDSAESAWAYENLATMREGLA